MRRVALVTCLLCLSCRRSTPPTPPAPEASLEGPVKTVIETALARVKSEPASADADGRLGMVCQVHGLLAEARAAYLKAGELDPRAVSAHPEDATARLAMVEALLKPSAERGVARSDESVREREVKRASSALGEFERTLTLQADAVDAYDGAGMAHMQLWDLSWEPAAKERHLNAAVEQFSQAVKWFPHRKEGHVHLVQALRSAQKNRELLEAVRRARGLWPDEARFRE